MTAGPMVLDRVSGTLVGEEEFEEFATVTLLGSNFQPIEDPITIGKNFPVIRLSIPADALLFWDRAEGKLNWNGTATCLTLVDDGSGLGVARLVKRLEPAMPTGQVEQWRIQVKVVAQPGADPTFLIVQVEPGVVQEFPLVNNGQISVAVLFPPTAAVRMNVAARGTPGTRVELGSWNIIGSQAKALDYSIVCRTDGNFRWATSGFIVKPYFLNLDYVKARFDTGPAFDSGFLMLE
jgi:hypothetical protein